MTVPADPASPLIAHADRALAARVRSTPAGDGDRAHRVAVLGLRAKLRVAGPRDARVAAIAAAQRGHVARRQMLAAGLSTGQVDWMLRRGDRLFPRHPGVYAVGHPGPVALGDETAALLAAPAGALLCCRSAAALWGLSAATPDDGLVDVLIPVDASLRRAGIRTHRSRLHGLAEPRVRARLPVTSPAQTILDLATELDEHAIARLTDEALTCGTLALRDLARVLTRLATHPGGPRLRDLLADAEAGVTESEAERRLRSLLRQTDLREPRRNAWVQGYRLDCYWPDARLAVEVDGYRFHSTRRRFEHDRVRDARLAAAGVEVMRVTWRQLEHEPLAVIARIAAALERRMGAGDR